MSMISSMLGRKQQPALPPQQQQQQAADQKTNGHTGAGGEAVEPVSIDILEPFMEAISLSAFTGGGRQALGMPFSTATASMDWKETPTAHVFMADVPGLRKEEVKVEVEQERVLRISGQRARAAEEKGDRWRRVERSAQRFVRTVRLPPDADTDGAGVHAAIDNGVLTVTIPKENGGKAHGRIIPITN